METLYDEYIKFPIDHPEYEKRYDELRKFCDCVEGIEIKFGIQLSCGDGKYLSDIEDDDAELEKYDGKVCLVSLPRFTQTGKTFVANKPYRFTIKITKDEELRYYLNSKEVQV
jgi:hypothetical protein